MVAAATGARNRRKDSIKSEAREPENLLKRLNLEARNFYESAVTQPQTKPDFQSTKIGKERC
jgi:hypothetical protein